MKIILLFRQKPFIVLTASRLHDAIVAAIATLSVTYISPYLDMILFHIHISWTRFLKSFGCPWDQRNFYISQMWFRSGKVPNPYLTYQYWEVTKNNENSPYEGLRSMTSFTRDLCSDTLTLGSSVFFKRCTSAWRRRTTAERFPGT